jgi:hypothetical protein
MMPSVQNILYAIDDHCIQLSVRWVLDLRAGQCDVVLSQTQYSENFTLLQLARALADYYVDVSSSVRLTASSTSRQRHFRSAVWV